MDGENFSNCSPCNLRNLTKPSVVFCLVCDESLCNECREHHKVLKLSRGHQLLAIDDYRELPPLLQNIQQFCETHGDILEFFCQSHDEVCCKRCATTIHSKCNESVKFLQDLIGTSVTCPSFDDISKSLADLEVNTNAAITDREKNMEDLTGQTQAILQDMNQQRQKLNEHLDKLEARMKCQLDTQFNQASTNISQTLRSLRDRHTQVVDIKRSVNQMKESHMHSVPYLFICKRAIISSVEKLEKEIKHEYESKAFLNTSLEYRVQKMEVTASNIVMPLGEVVTEVDKSPRFNLHKFQSMGAQGSSYRKNEIRTIKLSLKDTITLSNVTDITGCTVCKDGSVIVTDCPSVKADQLINICKKKEKRIQVRNACAFDVLNIDENTVAVTTGVYGERIDRYERERLNIRKPLYLVNAGCFGATVQDEFIIVCSSGYEIKKVRIETGEEFQVTPKTSSWNTFTYVTSDDCRLYLSDDNNSTVTCIDNSGQLCWTFHKPEKLNYPCGITIDTNSNLYVAGYKTNNVVMISPDGQNHREILSSKDGLDKPRAIYYDKERSQLLVCNARGPLFLFQVM